MNRFLEMRRWWREFWNGRQNGIEGFNNALSYCEGKTDEEVFQSYLDFEPPQDRYDLGWRAGCYSVLVNDRGWSQEQFWRKSYDNARQG